MFFGLTNLPATFQWMMNDIFKDLISEGKVTIYLDDILIFMEDLEEHRCILFLKAKKCEFEVLETEYLGVIISKGQVRMDPIKLAGIAEWPTPTKKELQSFLGFTNFYRKFIKNYSKVVRALTQLTGNAEWTWGTAQNQAFQQLKKQMAEDVILTILNRTGQFRVEADASNGAIGAVLKHKRRIAEKDRILYYDNHVYVPHHTALRGEIIAQSHDHITAGHPGVAKTRELVLHEYWWPKMKKDIETYVAGCKICQRTKSSNQAKAAPLYLNTIPMEPWTHISVDMITRLPDLNGHNALLVIVNRFLKAIILIPCNIELSAEG
ncbi:uncharacterized protein ARMOST_03228 [Armillaria ostoyae]|uniref:Reverse transcriptase domain-containing protein n=1 Tax=Armillaria ostoyae TaxID=47428 RepID=A0A284QTY6_ARMOS|nr:uncharacterized protein ARMOST_03228 [Armillaria ostoyae]